MAAYERKRRFDKWTGPAIVAAIGTIFMIFVAVATNIAYTAKWAQATDDQIKSCTKQLEANKSHIQNLENKETENQRFQGKVEANLESMKDDLGDIKKAVETQQRILMRMERNGDKRD
jgi:septal ring factor EnvC (AmiA/AmiB activator)